MTILNHIHEYAPSGESFTYDASGVSPEELDSKSIALNNLSNAIWAISKKAETTEDERRALLLASTLIEGLTENLQ